MVVTYEVGVDEGQAFGCVVRDEAADDSALAVEVLVDEVDASVTNHADLGGEGGRFFAGELPIHLEDGIAAALSNGYYALFDRCLGRPQFERPFAGERNRCRYAGIRPKSGKRAEENTEDQYEACERSAVLDRAAEQLPLSFRLRLQKPEKNKRKHEGDEGKSGHDHEKSDIIQVPASSEGEV